MSSLDPADAAQLVVAAGSGANADDNQGPQLLRIIWALIAISTIFVALRLFVKIRMTKRLFWDDYLIVVSLLLGHLHAIFVTASVKYGLGRHMLQVIQGKNGLSLPDTMRIGMMTFAPGFLSPTAGRLSFMIFLLWVTGTNERIQAWPIYIFIGIQVVFNCISVVLFYSQCGSNLDVYWTLSKMLSTLDECWDPRVQTYWGYVAGSLNSVTDLFLTVYPAIIVSYSSMTLRSRLGLLSLLCLSSVAMVAAIKKTIESRVLSEWTDFTYNLIPFVVWMAVELNVVIIASSIPILRPVFKRHGLSRVLQRTVSDYPTVASNNRRHNPPVALEKGRMRTRTSSMSSEEKILPLAPVEGGPREQFTITRTVEVSVSHSPRDRALVHAALIGLPCE